MNYRIIVRICAILMAFSGFTILSATVYPILSYEWESARDYPTLISSLVDDTSVSMSVPNADLTKASNWFAGGVGYSNLSSGDIRYFTITVPKLRIDNASVAIGGEDLAKSLIQYHGTALPGKLGNAVIFGHSILPQFFDPKNYMAIFSTLHTLKNEDTVIVNYDGITYTYKVDAKFEVKPTDIQILDQSSSDSYITLVTCSPPGHPLKPKRLIVRAKLVPQTTAMNGSL